MYVGIDFLIGEGRDPYVVDVNLGLPGGASEFDLTHRVFRGARSGVFARIEALSRRAHGSGFGRYLDSLTFLPALKAFKLWMDGQGPFPDDFHPMLRLEDKWVQYRVLSPIVPMPDTRPLGYPVPAGAYALAAREPGAVLKRRLGRGGRGFALVDGSTDLAAAVLERRPYGALLQERIDSKAGHWTFSLRAVAFAGEFVCAYANLARRPASNHAVLAFVTRGTALEVRPPEFEAVRFEERSWEARTWFGDREPAYLRHNLYEDEVARAAFVVPGPVLDRIEELAVRVERTYEGLDASRLPRAWFEEVRPG